MSIHSTITAVICIVILCVAVLTCLAQLVFMACHRWERLPLFASILSSFVIAYITISYIIVVLRDFTSIPQLFWE